MKTSSISLFIACAVASLAAASDEVYAVRTVKPGRRTIAQTLVKTGSLDSPASVELCAKESGRLETAAGPDGAVLEEGSVVKRGERVATLDARPFKAARDASAAALESAKVALADAEREKTRTAGLFEDGTATRQELDAAETALGAAKAAVARAEAELTQAELALAETEVLSPMDGVISAKHLHPGAMVTPSVPLYTIVATDPLRVLLDVPTTAYPLVKPGVTTISATVDAYPGETVKLKVDRIYPTADADTRTMTVRALLPNPDGKYAPGMFVRGEIALDERADVLVVPMNALLRNVDRYSVYAVENGIARLHDVTIGVRYDDVMEIVSGVDPDDELVTDGMYRLADGVAVRVVE